MNTVRILILIPFLLLSGYFSAQVDISPLMASTLKAKNFNEFGLNIVVEDIEEVKTIVGDGKNGYNVKYIRLRVKRKTKQATTLSDQIIFIFGDFINGTLTGKGGIICGSDRTSWFINKLQLIGTGEDFSNVNLQSRLIKNQSDLFMILNYKKTSIYLFN